MQVLVRHRGFEPRTTWLKVKCSTDWANTPHYSDKSEHLMNTPLHNCCGCSNWASWIRTNVMQESKSCALPLGDSPSKMYLTAEGGYRDSNPGPPEPQSGALTNCAIPTISEPEGIRTPDPRLRRPLLYPAELQTHSVQKKWNFHPQSGWWESNPRIQLGRLVFYHWTTPAHK